MGLTSPFQDGNGKNQINCFPAMQDRSENYQKAFHLFRTGTGITKKNPFIRDLNGKPKKIFPLFRNKNSRRSHWEIYGSGKSRSWLVKLTTHKLIVSVDAVVGSELLATTLAGEHMAAELPNFMLARHLPRLESFFTDITEVNPLSLVLCPPTLMPSNNNMISLTNLHLTPAGQGARRWARLFMCSLKRILVLKVM